MQNLPMIDPETGAGCHPAAGGTLLDPTEADDLASTFKALADPTRVRLVRYLADSPTGTICACHLPAILGISQSTLSFHLQKLQAAGLVTREQRGKWAHWSLHRGQLAALQGFLAL